MSKRKKVVKRRRNTLKAFKTRYAGKRGSIKLRGGKLLANALKGQSLRIARLVDTEVEKRLKAERERPFLWRTRTGLDLPITEMETPHLQNAISYLQRRINYAFGNSTWLSTTRPLLESLVAMLKEAQRRNVDV